MNCICEYVLDVFADYGNLYISQLLNYYWGFNITIVINYKQYIYN